MTTKEYIFTITQRIEIEDGKLDDVVVQIENMADAGMTYETDEGVTYVILESNVETRRAP